MISQFFGRFKRLCITAALGIGAIEAHAAPVGTEPDIRRDPVVDAVAKVRPSVVNISTEQFVRVQDPFEEFFSQFFGQQTRQPQHNLGSGVIIDEDGYILTNTHVIERADRIGVLVGSETPSTNNTYEAKVVAKSSTSDITLLKIDPKHGEKFPPIRFARDQDLLLGETVIALGNPFGFGLSVSRGILSSTTRRPQPEANSPLDYQDWLQTDAAVNPGNSGGPLVDLRGELIGINNAVFRNGIAQGINFAIPIKHVGEALADVFTPESAGFWFGAHVKSDFSSLMITSVQPGSPAEKAGLRKGDVVLKVGGKAPKNFIQFMVEIIKLSGKENVDLLVTQAGAQRNISVKIIPQKNFFNAELIRQKIGVTMQELTADFAGALGVNKDAGLLIASVDRNSPAASAKMEPGFLVTSVDNHRVNDVITVAKMFYEKKKGDKVSLGLAVPQRRGGLIYFVNGAVDLKVR